QLAQLLDEAVEALDLADDDVGAVHEVRIAERAAEELCGALDAAERVLDLVCEAAGDRAERAEPVGPAGRRLERLLQREIVQDEDRAARAAGGVEDRRAGRAHRDVAPPGDEVSFAAPPRRALGEGPARHVADPRAPAKELANVVTE